MSSSTVQDYDRQQKMLVHALEWALGRLEGGPDQGSREYKAAQDLLLLLKEDEYDWVYDVEAEIENNDNA